MPKKKAKKEATAASSNHQKKASPAANNPDQQLQNLLLPASKISKLKQHNPYRVEEIVPGAVWVVPNFLEATECQAWIDFSEGTQKKSAHNNNNKRGPTTTTTSDANTKSRLEYVQHPATNYITNRECYRWQQDDPSVAQILFQRLQDSGIMDALAAANTFSPDYHPCACNPNIRLYKYEKGHAFGKHVDGSHAVEGVGMTEATVLVYLSDDCEGGATRFYPIMHHGGGSRKKSVGFEPKQGAMLVHIHGDRCLEHEGDPVLSGLKYILRTDIVYARRKNN